MPSPYYSRPWQFTYPLSHHAITADHAKQRLQDFSTSPDEMHTLHRYIKCCSGDLRMQLQAAFDSAIAQRSHCLLRPVQPLPATPSAATACYAQRSHPP